MTYGDGAFVVGVAGIGVGLLKEEREIHKLQKTNTKYGDNCNQEH